MGFLDKALGRNKESSGITLTENGKAKAESIEQDGSILRLKVIDYLDENGASSYREIAEATGYEESRIKNLAKILFKECLIRSSKLSD